MKWKAFNYVDNTPEKININDIIKSEQSRLLKLVLDKKMIIQHGQYQKPQAIFVSVEDILLIAQAEEIEL